jgi:hypothetical protein
MGKVILGPRDKELVELLSAYGFLPTGEILRRVFSRTNYFTSMRRLRQLYRAGVIERTASLDRAGEWLWLPTTKGGLLTGADAWTLGLNRNQLHHDMQVVRTRLALEDQGLATEWRPMRLLAQQKRKKRAAENKGGDGEPWSETGDIISDGIFILPTRRGPRVTALEVEIARKGKKRYDWLFRS